MFLLLYDHIIISTNQKVQVSFGPKVKKKIEIEFFTPPPKVIESWFFGHLGWFFETNFMVTLKKSQLLQIGTSHVSSWPSRPCKIFKRPENREDSSDFNDFLTKTIATTQTFFSKFSRRQNFRVDEKFSRRAASERTNEQNFAAASVEGDKKSTKQMARRHLGEVPHDCGEKVEQEVVHVQIDWPGSCA